MADVQTTKRRSNAQTHGLSGTAEHRVWKKMLARCSNQNENNYERYGARGVQVCERWRRFENFIADMGQRPSDKHQLDRFPNKTGNYEPGNCRWVTATVNARNKNNNVILTYNGESRCLAEWAEIMGMSTLVLWMRINRLGWPTDKALTTPVRAMSPRKTQ